VITNSNGTAVEKVEYMPFGQIRVQTGPVTSDYKFTDQEQDTSTGLYNYDARLYDPVIGRFVSADTIVPKPFDPQTLNRYAYTANNPLIYIDPEGHHYGSTSPGGEVDWGGEYADGTTNDAGWAEPDPGGTAWGDYYSAPPTVIDEDYTVSVTQYENTVVVQTQVAVITDDNPVLVGPVTTSIIEIDDRKVEENKVPKPDSYENMYNAYKHFHGYPDPPKVDELTEEEKLDAKNSLKVAGGTAVAGYGVATANPAAVVGGAKVAVEGVVG
jgi:RHS repeat-associated protein